MAADYQFHPDRDQSDKEKRRRERQFHVVDVPVLRVIGFSMIALLVFLRYQFVPETAGIYVAHPVLIGAVAVTYSLLAWAVLYAGFEALKPRFNLGTVFLALDVLVFTAVIYLTGGDRSWLFFLVIIRTADQANTNFKRALAFGHLSVAAYTAMLLDLLDKIGLRKLPL